MNIELARVKKKLAVMNIDGSNQVFIDLLKYHNVISSINISVIQSLKQKYEKEIELLERTESTYSQLNMNL